MSTVVLWSCLSLRQTIEGEVREGRNHILLACRTCVFYKGRICE